MLSVKPEKFSHPEYCIICQDWQKDHTSYSCPHLICKLCKKPGHVKMVCPDLLKTIRIKQEPIEITKIKKEKCFDAKTAEENKIANKKVKITAESFDHVKIKKEPTDEKTSKKLFGFDEHEEDVLDFITSKQFDTDAFQSVSKSKKSCNFTFWNNFFSLYNLIYQKKRDDITKIFIC